MKSTVIVLMLITAAVFAQSGSRTEPAPMDQQTVEAAPADGQPAASGGAATQTTAQEPQTCMGGGGIMSFVPMIAIIAIFYFLMIRPQQKQAKMLREMRDALQKDDRVITSGGIHGIITNLKGDVVTVRIAEGVKIDVDRNSLQLDSVEKEAAR
ncbi:MAG: preprotein translocase subunit YajC [Candidatus Fermentibacteraceae bacterium]|nr:preprotein translocase subunit YajC [Candidatus Fermentibacteraceae bacterium]MBN2609122.1 preprotein translocase subunit YajC [Candidatus Fermentibacteraceae bacterium]